MTYNKGDGDPAQGGLRSDDSENIIDDLGALGRDTILLHEPRAHLTTQIWNDAWSAEQGERTGETDSTLSGLGEYGAHEEEHEVAGIEALQMS